MTPIVKTLRNIYERVRGRFYDGPDPPRRLADMVVVFANMHPDATRAQWANFASLHAAECYRSGYVRGYEWCERDLDSRDPDVDPERLMEQMGHGWEWMDEPVELDDPDVVVFE